MTEKEASRPRALGRAKVLWEQSGLDLKTARQRQRERAYLESAHLSLQAAVNALSAVCVLHGHFQLPASSAVGLLQLCSAVAAPFQQLHPACVALENASAASPFPDRRGFAADRAMGKACLAHAEGVLHSVKKYLRDHRKQFFAP